MWSCYLDLAIPCDSSVSSFDKSFCQVGAVKSVKSNVIQETDILTHKIHIFTIGIKYYVHTISSWEVNSYKWVFLWILIQYKLGPIFQKKNVFFRALPKLALPSPQFRQLGLGPLFSDVKNDVLRVWQKKMPLFRTSKTKYCTYGRKDT